MNLVTADAPAEIIETFLWQHPDVDLNVPASAISCTAFQMVCRKNDFRVLEVFMPHADTGRLNLNHCDNYGFTPVMYACGRYDYDTLQRLVFHPKVRLDVVSWGPVYENTPIRNAFGHLEVMKWMVMSGKPLSFPQVKVPPGFLDHMDPENVACHDLWTRLLVDEDFVRYELLLEARTRFTAYKAAGISCPVPDGQWPDVQFLDLYATIVFVCDGLLREPTTTVISPQPKEIQPNAKLLRFLRLAQRLPLELQALLCLQVGGRSSSAIPTRQAELAFRHLARELSHIPMSC